MQKSQGGASSADLQNVGLMALELWGAYNVLLDIIYVICRFDILQTLQKHLQLIMTKERLSFLIFTPKIQIFVILLFLVLQKRWNIR